MTRGRERKWSVADSAWLVVVLSLAMAALIAIERPLGLVVPVGVGLALAVPALRPVRTAGFWGLLGLWLASLAVGSAEGFRAGLLLGALAFLAGGVAREEGVGRRLGGWLRRAQVQGALALVTLGPLALFNVYDFDRTMAAAPVSPAWRWLLVPLVGMMAIPGAGPLGFARVAPAAFVWVGASLALANHPHDPLALRVDDLANLAFWALALASWLHEAWAKVRPPSRREAGPSGPVRVSSGSGIA